MIASRILFKAAAALRHPKRGPDLSEHVVSVSKRFHSRKFPAREAVLVAFYKRPTTSRTAPSVIPAEGDLVLLAMKAANVPFLASQFALLGGIVEKTDLRGADDYLDVLHNALRREVKEETGLKENQYAKAYSGTFHDSKTGFLVHCFSGYLYSDPDSNVQEQHAAHANLAPANKEHVSFSWIPVRRVFTSRQVAPVAKRAVDLTLME